MTIHVQATYENGILRPAVPLDLPNLAQVHVAVTTSVESGQTQSADCGPRMAATLERLAEGGEVEGIGDPAAWQRHLRRDRLLE